MESIRVANTNLEEIERKDVAEVSAIFRNVLKQWPYIALLISNYIFNERLDYFYSASFELMNHSFVITHYPGTVQNSNPKLFPHIGDYLALLSSNQCSSGENFTPSIKGCVQQIQSLVCRHLVWMTKDSLPSSKFCKPRINVQLHVNENSVQLLAELIDLFTPHSGAVTDPFWGTMKTAIHALEIARSYICVVMN